MTAVPPKSLAAEAKDTFGTIASALLIALVIRVGLGQPYTIPSESMEPGLLVGDYILVSKFDYGWSRWSIPLGPPLFKGRVLAREPARGDVVVFAKPRDEHTTMIKRLIGKARWRVLSWQPGASLFKPWTSSSLRGGRAFQALR